MVASSAETRMRRGLVKAFIKADASELVLIRAEMVKTPAGGLKRGVGIPQPAQTCRLVPFKNRYTALTRDTPDGNIINLAYLLIGEWNADFQVGDIFQYNEAWYDVKSIEPHRLDRTGANITYHGQQVDDDWG